MLVREILHRIVWSKILLAILIPSLVWTLSLFIAPLTLPYGTVTGLEGFANHLDYPDLWNRLPLYQRAVYYFGDIQCHQMSNRSFYLNGNQLPVCARDVAIYLFLTIGLFHAVFLRRSSDISEMFINAFPRRFREFIATTIGFELFIPIFVILCLIPVGVDGGLQLLTEYESSNPVRFITGMPAGWMAGLLLGSIIISTKQFTLERKAYREAVESRNKQW